MGCKERCARSNDCKEESHRPLPSLDGERLRLSRLLLWSVAVPRNVLSTAERCAEATERKARAGSPAPKVPGAAAWSDSSPPRISDRISDRISADCFSADARPEANPAASTTGHAGMRASLFLSGDCLRKELSRWPPLPDQEPPISDSGTGGSGVLFSELQPSLSMSMSFADICTARSASLVGPVTRGGARVRYVNEAGA